MTARQWMILGLVALCAPLGDTCLSRGMTQVPVVTLALVGALIARPRLAMHAKRY